MAETYDTDKTQLASEPTTEIVGKFEEKPEDRHLNDSETKADQEQASSSSSDVNKDKHDKSKVDKDSNEEVSSIQSVTFPDENPNVDTNSSKGSTTSDNLKQDKTISNVKTVEKEEVKEDTKKESFDDKKEESSAKSIVPEVEIDSDDDDEGICLGDVTDLDSDGRNKMFERGLSFERNGKTKKALKCYMACLNGLTPTSRFALLPQCLRNIADIFYQREEYDKAVHFIQAEKVYYESALIDTRDIQTKLEEAQLKDEGLPVSVSSDTVRASEYEHLARLCLDRDQPQLALEYAGKATKLRQTVLGDKDPVTVESLDFFASVYAKVGAEQYEESLKKLSEKPEEGEDMEMTSGGDGDQKEPVSILRKRKNSEKEKKVHFDESVIQSEEQRQNEEQFAKTVLWALMIICSLLLFILALYLYCNLVGSTTCNSLKADLYYAYMRIKYWYYQYQSGPQAKFT